MALTPTAARRGKNATYHIAFTTPDTYVKIAEVKRIKPPSFNRDENDATHLESPDDMKEFIEGLIEIGEASFDINFVSEVDDDLMGAFFDGVQQHQIVAPNGIRMQFSGFVKTYEIGEFTADGLMTASVTVRPTTKPVMLAAS